MCIFLKTRQEVKNKMYNAEATGEVRPQTKIECRVTEKKRGYLWVVYVLFIIVLMLCVNNYIMYGSYKEIQNQIRDINQKLQGETNEKEQLAASNQQMAQENGIYKEQYLKIKKQNEVIVNESNEIRKQNDELVTKNKELTEDNIALQNSLKIAASVGVKPQNYTSFKGVNSRGGIDRGRYIGKFLGTAYTPCVEECGNNKGITNSGKPIMPGVSVAVDSSYWPFGTVFYIKGLGYAVAMDTGSAIKGKYRFDFSVFDKNFARTLGSKKWDVYLVEMGKGIVEDISF